MINKKAVALQYNKQKDKAPKINAKGKGYVAQQIIDIATQNDIYIKKDPDTVELLTKLDIDQEIPENMYKTIAEIFVYLYNVVQKDNADTK